MKLIEIDLTLVKERDCPGIDCDSEYLAEFRHANDESKTYFKAGKFRKQAWGWTFDAGLCWIGRNNLFSEYEQARNELERFKCLFCNGVGISCAKEFFTFPHRDEMCAACKGTGFKNGMSWYYKFSGKK